VPNLNLNLLGNQQIQEVLYIFLGLLFSRRQYCLGLNVSSNNLLLSSVPDLRLLKYSTCLVLLDRVVVIGKVVDFKTSNSSCF
jgi:hypothetical protein